MKVNDKMLQPTAYYTSCRASLQVNNQRDATGMLYFEKNTTVFPCKLNMATHKRKRQASIRPFIETLINFYPEGKNFIALFLLVTIL